MRRFSNVLKATKQRGFRGRIYGFDIETHDDNRGFVMASLYYDENNKWTFYDKQELINFFKTKRFWNSIIVASNLAFDFFGTFFNREECKNFDLLFRGSELLYARTYIRNKSFHKKSYTGSRRGEDKGSRGKRLVFLDTFNYCKMSVERLGRIIGVAKLSKPDFLGLMPSCPDEWQELADYNMRDSEISKKYLKFLYEAFEELGATPKLTIASTAMSLFKNKYLNDDVYFRHEADELLEIFNAYYGGRTEVFERGNIKDHNYYDFNSLYPAVMESEEFPNPNSKRITFKNTVHYINKYHGCSDVTIHCPSMPYPLLPLRHEGKLLFPTGTFKGWYSHVELREAVSNGYTIKEVHKTYYYKENCRPFRQYVNDLYERRMKYKSEGNPMEQVAKLLLNSLYGKFGQKFVDRDNWQPFNLTLEELHKLSNFEIVGDYIRVKKPFTTPSAFCIPIWALHVTAYGRIKMHRAMKECKPVYVDTDSLLTECELPESRSLGMLKKEMRIDCGIIVKPKMYALVDSEGNDHVRIKGIAKRLNFLEFNGFLANPKITYDKFMKFKESVRRGFVPNELCEITKQLTLEDEKRVWEKPFNFGERQTSTAIRIIDGMTDAERYEVIDRKAKVLNSQEQIIVSGAILR